MADKLPGPRDTIRAVRDLWRSDLSRAVGRIFKWVVTIGVVGVIGSTWLGAWRFADSLLANALTVPAVAGEPAYDDGRVIQFNADSISIRPGSDPNPALQAEGTFGLEFAGGRGVIGDVISEGSAVVRQWTPVEGEIAEGTNVAIAPEIYFSNPADDLGIPYQDVSVSSPVEGDLPAWYVPGERSTWVIFVHGRGSDRTQALRLLPVFVEHDFPALLVSYRNDEGTVFDLDGRYHYGLEEWRDLEAAVRWARGAGAERFILVGYEMGAGISLEFVNSSPFADQVSGLVLDAPLLDLGAAVDASVDADQIPGVLRSLGKTIGAFRFGVNWAELNYIAKYAGFDVLTLLIHGTDDERVPVELSDELEERAGDELTYLRVEGAGHDQSWNVATEEYEEAIRQFITRVVTADLERPGDGEVSEPDSDQESEGNSGG